MKKHSNLLSGIVINHPEQVFASNIAYVESDEGIHYLSLVTDASSRKIMGHEVRREMKASDTVKAMKRAIRERQTQRPLIHHSDRDSQYCPSLYQRELERHNIKPP